MIRLLDTEAFVIQQSYINRRYVRKFFLEEKHIADILIVYDGMEYVGIVTYDSFLNSTGMAQEDGYIFRERYIHQCNNENIWMDIRKLFEKQENGNLPIPVFNEYDELLYFAYQNIGSAHEERMVYNILSALEKILPERFFREVYPKIKKVVIYNLNEFGYRFYKVMQKCGYCMEAVGEKWELLFPGEKNNIMQQESIPESCTIFVYSEGTSFFFDKFSGEGIFQYWHGVLAEIAGNYYKWIEEQMVKRYTNMYLLRVNIPMRVEFKTIDEYKRMKEGISFHVLKNGSTIQKELFCKAFGRKITWEEWQTAKGISENIMVAGEAVAVRSFGNESQKKVYVIGPCIIEGDGVPCVQEMFLYCLYRELKDKGIDCCIKGITVGDYDRMDLYKNILDILTVTDNDIIISIFTDVGTYSYKNQRKLDLKKLYDERNTDWFYDWPIHTNYVGNQKIAKEIANNIRFYLENLQGSGKYIKIGKRMLSESEKIEIEQYIRQVQQAGFIERKQKYKIGAIVMNCNPMTKGHLFLIETACKKVDYLYVFVVEEDRSEISFQERYHMIKTQTELLKNVIVVPSGRFILSYMTLPLYFEKYEKQEAVLDAANDLKIFCQYIAPQLGITERFVGEEPTDKITKQYNEKTKRILPYYGIQLTEIPRLKVGNLVVSASKVREYMKDNNLDGLKRMVPDKVYECLKSRCCKN